MELTFTSTETLEHIYSQKMIFSVFQTILKQKSLQERVETKFLPSLRAKSTFADWGAALCAINPMAVLKDGKSVPLASLLEKKVGALNDLNKIHFDVNKSDLLAYEKVSNTPTDQPIVSVVVFIKFKGKSIDQLRIAATGVSKSAYICADFSKDFSGKTLDEPLITTIRDQFKKETSPGDTYIGSAEYRREMAGVLVERILLKIINGEM